MSTCIEWGKQWTRKCNEYREDRIKKCSEWEEKWDKQCSDWDDKCCDWWPCSWGCKLVTWVCIGWKYVSTWVCKGWYWVVNIVCVAWVWVVTAVCVAWDVITTVVNAILETLESILVWILDALALIINIILSLPIIGRLIEWLKSIVLEAIWRIFGLPDGIFGLLGWRPEKKLRICTIIVLDEKDQPVAKKSDIVEEIQRAIDIFKEQANVRLIRSAPFQYDSGFAGNETATEDWISTRDMPTLDVECGVGSAGEDLWLSGTDYEVNSSFGCFYGKFRRLIGYGAPITIFVVRSIDGGDTTGCSLGPLTDYVTVVGTEIVDKTTIAHELGHSCGLDFPKRHSDDPTNLMYGTDSNNRRDMTAKQVFLFRNSRHVTYF